MAEIEGFNFPDDLYYHPEHAWVRLEDDGTVTIGINDFAQDAAGEISYIDLPFQGDEVVENETMAKIQTAKWVGPVKAPVSGEVVEINEELEFETEAINESPYGAGWICRIQPSDWDLDQDKLMRVGDELHEWLKKEKARAEAEKAAAGIEDEEDE